MQNISHKYNLFVRAAAALALVLAATSSQARGDATPAASDLPSPEDEAALLRVLKPYVYVMNKPSYIYNWHTASDDSRLWEHSQDPRAYSYAQWMASQYWAVQGNPNQDMFGLGYYAALDPVATRTYGGDPDEKKWALTELHIPAGFRLIDVSRDGDAALPLDQVSLVTRLGCPEEWKKKPLLNNLLNPGTYKDHPKCAAAIRKVLKDDLKIDGFAYGYGATQFQQCDPPQEGDWQKQAFVITSGAKLKPEDVKIFNRTTTDDTAARIRIQSLFTMAESQNAPMAMSTPAVPQSPLAAQLEAANKTKYIPWLANQTTSGSSYSGTNLVKSWSLYCERQLTPAGVPPTNTSTVTSTSVTTPAPPPPPPLVKDGNVQVDAVHCVLISTPGPSVGAAVAPPTKATEPTELHEANVQKGNFLWKDLEGKAVTPNLKTWMRQNIYGCVSGNSYQPYKQSPSNSNSENNAGPSPTPSGTDAR